MYLMIPTGERVRMATQVADKWRRTGIGIVTYTWDKATYAYMKRIQCARVFYGYRKPFGVLHNFMIQTLPNDWSGAICGADDLWPTRSKKYKKLKQICQYYDGKVLWIYDKINKKINTHPVITRGWYEKHKIIFNECFSHHCCDSDLMMRTRDDIIKVKGLEFDHHHPLKTPIEKRDKIYQLGHSTLKKDRLKLRSMYKRIDLDVIAKNCEVVRI